MDTHHHYDLVVIGCGPGGEKGAAQAAWFGKRVAVVNDGPLGGVWVHTGTLPSKALRESAMHVSGLRSLGIAGIQLELAHGIEVEELLAHQQHVAARETQRIAHNLARHGIDHYEGRARFDGPHTLAVAMASETIHLHADIVLVATGSRPRRPADLPFASERVWDSDAVLRMKRLPQSIIVYGAGVIGCEYASIFAALGVEVVLLEPRGAILPFLDTDIAEELVSTLREGGIRIRTNAAYTDCTLDEGGVTLRLGDDSVVRAEVLLFAAGRVGNTDDLGLETVELQANKRGQLEVDKHYRTALGHVYAVGDVIGFPALASTSMDQARIAMCHAFGESYKTRLPEHLPYGIYTIPECAMIGATEQQLRREGRPFETGRTRYADNARGQLSGNPQGMLKLLVDPHQRTLLGVHVVGDRASEIVHVGMLAMQLGARVDALIDAVWNNPTLSEMYKYAAYDALGRMARREAFANRDG
jgi:NAD(P) transhydrogenase